MAHKTSVFLQLSGNNGELLLIMRLVIHLLTQLKSRSMFRYLVVYLLSIS